MKNENKVSTRADLLTRRTYCRPKEAGTFETWEDVVNRVIEHQQWLWIRARFGYSSLSEEQETELQELKELMLSRKVSMSGRTLWLGGTDIAKTRESSMFNCSFLKIETVYDVVDAFWLLLQGCGVGFKPVRGTLNGFFKPIKEIEVISSTKKIGERGRETNLEKIDKRNKVWTLSVGDSAEAWAKSIGKLLAGKHNVDKLILDFSEIRSAGERLKGYGWISSGDEAISKAYVAIAGILNRKAGCLLSGIDLLDIINHLGTVLSSRRSAQICLIDIEDYEAPQFILAKKDYWQCKSCKSHYTLKGVCLDCGASNTNDHRTQSNNSILFWKKPSREQLESIFDRMVLAGGSEPGFINAEAATRRAPFFSGGNPCFEVLLANKSFCNLSEIDLGKFIGDTEGLLSAIYLVGRANYRQTCVNLQDGLLQEAWHLNNEFLRLCGVGLTGIAKRDDLMAYDYRTLERAATSACYSMADELGMQRPKNCTVVKPSGTLSKIMDTTEGLHKPLGKYIFNNVVFSNHDESLKALKEANYRIFDHPKDTTSCVVTFPVSYEDASFTLVNGTEVNLESATSQLDKYKLLQDNYTQQNSSVTISYDVTEKEAILDWFMQNWDSYVGVSFLFRNDPTKTAKDLGYAYLPQEVVTKEVYEAYVATLKEVVLGNTSDTEVDAGGECAGGGRGRH